MKLASNLQINLSMRVIRYILVFSLLSLEASFASSMMVEKPDQNSLIQWPSYRISTGEEEYRPSKDYFSTDFSECTEWSEKVYEKLRDPNQHSEFPLVPKTPVVEDQIGAHFFKEVASGEYYVTRWSSQDFPLVKFYLTKQSKKYEELVKKVFFYINQKALEFGVVSDGDVLVELGKEYKSIRKESCNLQLIHFEKVNFRNVNDFVLGENFSKIDKKNPDRIGEIRDSDVVVYVKNIEKLNLVGSETREDKLFEVLVHELMHSLGLDHNFALGTFMDYSKKINTTLDYEMSALAVLYGGAQSTKNWPLVRARKKEDTYIPEEKHFWVLDQWYDFTLNDKASLMCKDVFTGNEVDYKPSLPKNFRVQFHYPDNKTSYTDSEYVRIKVKDLLHSGVFGTDQVIEFSFFSRLFPMIHRSVLGSKYKGKKGDTWIYPSPFVGAFTAKKESELNWHFYTQDQNTGSKLECFLNANVEAIIN